jgi:type III pantothenate kinase
MLLAIDIGNTHVVLGVFSGSTLKADWRISSAGNRTADEIWLTIRSFCDGANIRTEQITQVGISSVVPNLTEIFESIATKYLRTTPFTINGNLDLGIRVQYREPASVGADRLCNAVAGFRKYGGPLIIIDFGTATTFDVVSADGDYLGGVICLGLESSAAELHRRAAKLPKVDLRFPPVVVGVDTVTSIQAGLLYGTVDMVEGIVRRIRTELGAPARVIATGGLSSVVADHTNIIEAVEPALVLEGIRMIVEGKSA